VYEIGGYCVQNWRVMCTKLEGIVYEIGGIVYKIILIPERGMKMLGFGRT
jgi:hypothetical protein